MRFKSFVFPQNPEKCSIDCDREIAKHKYPELSGEELEDLNPNAAVVAGEGVFLGSDALNNWNDLLEVYRSGGVAPLIHPFFPLKQAMFKKLRGEVEPGDGAVRFEFEFWEHIEPIRQVPAVSSGTPSADPKAKGAKTTKHTVKQGDTLWALAEKYLGAGTRWQEIAKVNGIKDPKTLQIGTVLVINV